MAHNYGIQESTNRADNIQGAGSCSGQPASLCKAKFASSYCKDSHPLLLCWRYASVSFKYPQLWTFWESASELPLTSKPVLSLHLESRGQEKKDWTAIVKQIPN